jgi:signal transduction histidine kinase
VVLALFSYVYWSTASYVRSRSDQAIMTELAILEEAYANAGNAGLTHTIEQRLAERRFEDGIYLLADSFFTPIAGNLKVWPSEFRGSEGWGNFNVRNGKSDSSELPLLRAAFDTLPDGNHLLVGKDIDDLDGFAREIGAALLWGLSLIFALAGVASVLVTRRTVGRIEAINTTSRAIMQSGLGERISLRGTHDEWDHLAENLNLMLDRIEGLMGDVKQVTDNVAHDLRTPLARMRGRLEMAYNTQRNGDRDQLLIGDMMADLDAVLRMFTSLMRISQIEENDQIAVFRTINLSEIASEVVELYDAAAEQKAGHLRVAADQQVLIAGDRSLLFDAVANLVDNAIKHGREAGRVSVEVTQSDETALISVADDGPGIPANECQQVLKRFYRLERSRCTPGNGLGLSLVAAVTRLHGARIEMVDNAPGLKFRLVFPLRAVVGVEKMGLSTKHGNPKQANTVAGSAGTPVG